MNSHLIHCPSCLETQVNRFYIGEYPIYKCNTCYLQFLISTEVEEKSYKNYFQVQRTNDFRSTELRQFQYKIDAEHLIKGNGGALLDVGCSNGAFLQVLSNYNVFENLVGLDVDKSALVNFNKNNKNKNIETFLTDLVSFDNNLCSINKFDSIIFRGTFQYLGQNLHNSLLKAKKLLNSKGKIYIYSLPHSDSFIFHLLKENWNMFNPAEHRLFFNTQSIIKMAGNYGFNIVEISFPYIGTAYENLEKDYKSIIKIIKEGRMESVPFFGNIIQIVLQSV